MHMTDRLLNVILTVVSNNPGDTSHSHIVTTSSWNDTVMLEFTHASVT